MRVLAVTWPFVLPWPVAAPNLSLFYLLARFLLPEADFGLVMGWPLLPCPRLS